MNSPILTRRYMPASAFLAVLYDVRRGDVPEIIYEDIPDDLPEPAKPVALRISVSQIVYDANGYHEGRIMATFTYPLVPAQAHEVYPPSARVGRERLPLDPGPLTMHDALVLAHYLVCLDTPPDMTDTDAPADALYDCSCGRSADSKTHPRTGITKHHREHEHEVRYSRPSDDELYDMLCPTHDGWESRSEGSQYPSPYFQWTFVRGDDGGFGPGWRLARAAVQS